MDIQIKSALIGAIIPTVSTFAIFFLGDFSTQSKLERDTVKVLSEKFDTVKKICHMRMPYKLYLRKMKT